jgi:sigma-B regulation protein RsbU (phosphoserine phosphatase)
MASLRNLMRFAAHSEAGPLETLKSVNLHAMPDLKGEHFVTVCYVEIDLAAHSGILVTAGHDPALLVSGQEVKPVRGKGMPIGVAEPEDFDFVLRECRFDLAPGEMLALYTDGITEAMDAQQKQFGRTALEAALKGGGDAKGTLERVLKAVHAHVGECEPSDDLTALILRRVA